MFCIRKFSTDAPTLTAKQLYKYLLRECNKLPKDASSFYKFTIRQSFKQHVTESDPERIQQIITRALEDSKWVILKYSNKIGGRK